MPQHALHDPPAPTLAWSRDDLRAVHARDDKHERVRAMFGAIAHRYDLNNRLHALGLDVLWRRAAVRAARVRPAETVLDVACGTGDLTLEFARRSPAARVVGADFTPRMLDFAARKRARLAPALARRVDFLEADAMALPFPDASFDVVSIAFGIRNVQFPDRALAEFARVLRPAGRLVILEFDRPRLAPVRWFNSLYCERVMPLTASWIARDRSGAYRYLPTSVREFKTADELARLALAAGFERPHTRRLSLGICALTTAHRPA